MKEIKYPNSSSNAETQILSFDLWLTLIKSDGVAFKQARNAMLGSELAPHLSDEEFDAKVRLTDKQADRLAESRGEDVLFDERVQMVAKAMGLPAVPSSLLGEFYAAQTKLMYQYPPKLIDSDTPDIFDRLRVNHQLAIISNTGFIHGAEISSVAYRG